MPKMIIDTDSEILVYELGPLQVEPMKEWGRSKANPLVADNAVKQLLKFADRIQREFGGDETEEIDVSSPQGESADPFEVPDSGGSKKSKQERR